MSNTNLLEGTIDLEQKDLAMLRKQYEAEKPSPSSSTTFNYAWGLVHSNRREEIQLGVELLTQLVRTAPTMRDEARYYAALGCFKMGEFSRARDMAQAILKDHPNNPQALSIVDAVDEQVRKDGMIGMAIVGGAVAAVGLVVGLLTRSSK
ncbi:mitochondria fission 1 protein, variant [Catenaria anguillulae PL171]|uniref:Mitochondrial fission 1 protein n=1 Tax=Catenaria anguillulae PL171 TaxID=765915 RepID=A0A1Y2I0D6_9FUNG|nr:mitochondria fission 1 protein, variant [Catenaria anguillulae PL171]